MMHLDPPEHTRLRTLVSKAFAATLVEALRETVQALTDELLSPAREAGYIDRVQDLARPLPALVIGDLLGVPRKDRSTLQVWSDGIAAGMVLSAAHPDYERARRVWNGCIDRAPAVIARCRSTNDVVAAINFARDKELVLAVRAGGHGLPGFGICDKGLVLDLSAMHQIDLDPSARLARAGGGCTWRQFDAATVR